ncbi:unnamed protein product [Caenorhabditis angaria]|uniref:Uncharacterized protein n=1 Tax=Caenorhabditis angaria TaxID=860376 RepID=A0A9P1MYX0_9PELO|nr:unnamed protein product [Caenorhabditis angaria]
MYTQPPRFMCFDARLVVIVLCVVGIVGSVVQTFKEEEFSMKFATAFSILFEIITLVGAVKNNVVALRISLYISLINAIFLLMTILVVPVIFASMAAAGITPTFNETQLEQELASLRNDSKQERHEHFVHGLVAGYTIEFLTAIGFACAVAKYVLINRVFVYAKAIEASSTYA